MNNQASSTPSRFFVDRNDTEFFSCMMDIVRHTITNLSYIITTDGIYVIRKNTFALPEGLSVNTTFDPIDVNVNIDMSSSRIEKTSRRVYNVVMTIIQTETCPDMIISISFFDDDGIYITSHFDFSHMDVTYALLTSIIANSINITTIKDTISCSIEDLQLAANKLIKNIILHEKFDYMQSLILKETYISTIDFNAVIVKYFDAASIEHGDFNAVWNAVTKIPVKALKPNFDIKNGNVESLGLSDYGPYSRQLEPFIFILPRLARYISDDNVRIYKDHNGRTIVHLFVRCYYYYEYVVIQIDCDSPFVKIVTYASPYETNRGHNACNIILNTTESFIIRCGILSAIKNMKQYDTIAQLLITELNNERDNFINFYEKDEQCNTLVAISSLGYMCKKDPNTRQLQFRTVPSITSQYLMILYGLHVCECPFERLTITYDGSDSNSDDFDCLNDPDDIYYVKTVKTGTMITDNQYWIMPGYQDKHTREFIYQLIIPENGSGIYIRDLTRDYTNEYKLLPWNHEDDYPGEEHDYIRFKYQIAYYRRLGKNCVKISDMW